MNCHDYQDLLELYAVDALDAVDTQRLTAHLNSPCAECQEKLAAALANWSVMAEIAPVAEPPETIKQNLFARLQDDSSASHEAHPPAPPGMIPADAARPATNDGSRNGHPRSVALPRQSVPILAGSNRWHSAVPLLAALFAGIAAGAILWPYLSQATDPQAASRAQLRRQIQEFEQSFDLTQVRQSSLVALNGRASTGAHLILDPAAAQLHVYAYGLPALPQGQHYRFWLVTNSNQWKAGPELSINAQGQAKILVPLPAEAGDEVQTAITLQAGSETDPPPVTPGPIQLQGTLRLGPSPQPPR
jgi:hypothetical protein